MRSASAPLSAQSILIDFGKNDSGFETSGNWNNFAEDGIGGDAFRFPALGANGYTMLTDMIDSSGTNTGVVLVYFEESSSGQLSNISSGIGGADNNEQLQPAMRPAPPATQCL